MAKLVAFDLETIADHEILKALGPPDVKLGNLKDEKKIEEKIANAKIDRIAKAGLNPHENMICLFTWHDGDNTGHVVLEGANAKAEAKLLEETWEVLSKFDHFITFNGIEFDVPILNLHSLFRGIRPAVNISTKKYNITNHTDLRAVLGRWDKFAPGNLDFYLRRCLGRKKPDDISGSFVQHYWDIGLVEDIVKYGEQDAVDTYDLYQYAKQFYPM